MDCMLYLYNYYNIYIYKYMYIQIRGYNILSHWIGKSRSQIYIKNLKENA